MADLLASLFFLMFCYFPIRCSGSGMVFEGIEACICLIPYFNCVVISLRMSLFPGVMGWSVVCFVLLRSLIYLTCCWLCIFMQFQARKFDLSIFAYVSLVKYILPLVVTAKHYCHTYL